MTIDSYKSGPTGLLRYRDSIYAVDLLICAATDLDFFTRLKSEPLTFEDICRILQTAQRPTDVMLTLFQAMELIQREGRFYRLTDLSEEYLVSDNAASLVPYYASLKNRPQCEEFLQVLRTGKPAGWSSKKEGTDWLDSMRDEQFAASFTAAMDSRGRFLAQKLAEKIQLVQFGSLLDVAGGSGIYACLIADRFPHLKTSVLELPPVDEATRHSIDRKGMLHRVSVIAGDMFGQIPTGYDVHLLANVLHDWDIEAIQKLIRQSYGALPEGGRIIVFDAHLNLNKDGPLSVAEYSCLLMHSTEGRCYSIAEVSDMLRQSGFINITATDLAADRSIITGDKSES